MRSDVTEVPLVEPTADAVALQLVPESEFAAWLPQQPEVVRNAAAAQRFAGRKQTWALVLDAMGQLQQVLVGCTTREDLYALAALAPALPPQTFALPADLDAAIHERLALGFALGAYQYTRYKPKAATPRARLVVADGATRQRLTDFVTSVFLARDLVNTPTEDMGPEQLAAQIQSLAADHGAECRVVQGEDLLQQNFPAIHAVGRASHRAPRLIELNWGDPDHPRVAILGKGVCFDTGGLDLKSADGMALMKKDMGGAAVALALAQLVMARKLRLRLQLLLPAVENAIGPNAFRPGEVLATRAGLSVEIGNTDAEGRLVLCDALAYAVESAPALILDFATLTGAARIALGPDLPALFANDEELSAALARAGREVADPLWPMPLWEDYYPLIDSKIADINNAGSSRMAGAVTAALFLKRFVPDSTPWAHIDTYCWSEGKPGRPAGGDCQSLRAAFAYLKTRFG